MPPKALNKTDVDDILCEFLPKEFSKETKLSILNDTGFKSKNMSFKFNYDQLTEVASTIDITLDYKLMVIHAKNCVDSLKNIW